MAPDRSQCPQSPHQPDHHPNGLASHHGPVILPHRVGALLESWLMWRLFPPPGFHFYSTVSRQSFIETRTAGSCILKLNEEIGGTKRLQKARRATDGTAEKSARQGLGLASE